MSGFSRAALDPALDIIGTNTINASKLMADEASGLGQEVSGQSGAAANVTTVNSGVATITGLTGMTVTDVGNFLTLSGAGSAGNNGTFLIVNYNSATSVDVSNASAVASDANNGSIAWQERAPYSLEDDINFERTDRKAIKGTANPWDAVPTYQRPTAVGTNVPANLTNIAGKTTDAKALCVTRAFFGATVAATNTKITITSAGNLKHAASVDTTGVPCFDAAPFTGDFASCYVEITNASDGAELIVRAGGHAGERIFGVTNGGSSTSPNSVEVLFYSCPIGADPAASSTAYTWESGQPTSITLGYGFNQRIDQLDQNALRTTFSLGLVTDADIRQDVNDIQSVIGEADGATSLTGLLTNLTGNYPFQTLSATPTVVAALNVLNADIGDRTYTGSYLTSGQTVAQSLQALSSAISTASITRTIERLTTQVAKNTPHLLPGGLSYTLDGSGNGNRLWVYWDGVLRHPGTLANFAGNEYAETDTTHITPYTIIKVNSCIDYFTH